MCASKREGEWVREQEGGRVGEREWESGRESERKRISKRDRKREGLLLLVSVSDVTLYMLDINQYLWNPQQ